MTDKVNDVHKTVEEATDHREKAIELTEEAESQVAEAVADVYGFDTDDISVSHGPEHYFEVTIRDTEQATELSKRFPDEYSVNPAMTIEVGNISTRNQRDLIKDLKHLIEGMEDEYEEGAPIEELLDEATAIFGMSESKVEDEIESLRRKGELYEPRQDYLRTT